MAEPDWSCATPVHPDDLGLTRRSHITGLFAAFTVIALASETACAAPQRRMAARDWIERQGELARAFRRGEITPLAWMVEVERLAAEIDVAELMAEVNAAQITANTLSPTNDPAKRSIRFLDSNGAPRRLGFGAALFDFTPANVITPHGHRHMASSHLIVDGRFRIRNFDRIGDIGQPGSLDEAMVIRPTRDMIAGVGTLSAMSATRDNIHWFVPQGGPARTFDVVVSGLDPDQPDYDIRAIDPLRGQTRADGTIVAPVIGFEEASSRYTASV
jgi:hypothetical protein